MLLSYHMETWTGSLKTADDVRMAVIYPGEMTLKTAAEDAFRILRQECADRGVDNGYVTIRDARGAGRLAVHLSGVAWDLRPNGTTKRFTVGEAHAARLCESRQ